MAEQDEIEDLVEASSRHAIISTWLLPRWARGTREDRSHKSSRMRKKVSEAFREQLRQYNELVWASRFLSALQSTLMQQLRYPEGESVSAAFTSVHALLYRTESQLREQLGVHALRHLPEEDHREFLLTIMNRTRRGHGVEDLLSADPLAISKFTGTQERSAQALLEEHHLRTVSQVVIEYQDKLLDLTTAAYMEALVNLEAKFRAQEDWQRVVPALLPLLVELMPDHPLVEKLTPMERLALSSITWRERFDLVLEEAAPHLEQFEERVRQARAKIAEHHASLEQAKARDQG